MKGSCVDPEWLKAHPIVDHVGKLKRTSKNRGYPAIPGSGPKGETCGTCGNLARKSMAKDYLKCKIMIAKWTGGPGTDVKARSPSCSYWKPKNVTETR